MYFKRYGSDSNKSFADLLRAKVIQEYAGSFCAAKL